MTQNDRLDYLISYLLKENDDLKYISIPDDISAKKKIFRALMNVRPPAPVSKEFLKIQDEYLQAELKTRNIADGASLPTVSSQLNIALWQGDITNLKVDAIVNAANSALLGCFYPLHSCIDNIIHSRSGVQLRLSCNDIMKKQGHDEETGNAKITPAFNLPSKYVIHTVGPIISGSLTQQDCRLLESCYRSCLALALENDCKSIAFCCISTGEFHFPNQTAAEIAVDTVKDYLENHPSGIKVIFNVFKDIDFDIYEKLLY